MKTVAIHEKASQTSYSKLAFYFNLDISINPLKMWFSLRNAFDKYLQKKKKKNFG